MKRKIIPQLVTVFVMMFLLLGDVFAISSSCSNVRQLEIINLTGETLKMSYKRDGGGTNCSGSGSFHVRSGDSRTFYLKFIYGNQGNPSNTITVTRSRRKVAVYKLSADYGTYSSNKTSLTVESENTKRYSFHEDDHHTIIKIKKK